MKELFTFREMSLSPSSLKITQRRLSSNLRFYYAFFIRLHHRYRVFLRFWKIKGKLTHWGYYLNQIIWAQIIKILNWFNFELRTSFIHALFVCRIVTFVWTCWRHKSLYFFCFTEINSYQIIFIADVWIWPLSFLIRALNWFLRNHTLNPLIWAIIWIKLSYFLS